MAGEHFVVVVYDISNDKRRTRLHKCLKDFGTPVQYSVFECILETDQVSRLEKSVNRIIKPRLDHVRFYHLCKSCRSKITVTGRKEVTRLTEVILV